MRVRLVTLSGVQFDEEALEIHVVSEGGAMTILPNHEPITAMTAPGPVTIVNTKNEDEIFASYGGIIEVTGDNVRILLDEADYASDLVESEVHEAMKAAQALKSKAKDQKELDEAQKIIDRQAVRLQVAQLRRRRPRG